MALGVAVSYRVDVHFSYQLPILFLLTLSGLGCGAHRSAADQHFDTLKAEINKLQADQDRILERLEGLEVKKSKDSKDSDERSASSEDRPPLKVVVLHPEGEMDEEPSEIDGQEGNDAPRTLVRAYGNDAEGKGGKRAKKEEGQQSADAERDYQEALSLLKKKQHRRALDLLSSFQVRYPANPRIDAALFWIAECYAALGDGEKATEYYEAVLARFPQGSKAPDALLRLAAIHKKRGADERARELLTRLRSDFPQSDAARRAPKE